MVKQQLLYVSSSSPYLDHVQGIHKACKAGIEWAILRFPNASNKEHLKAALHAKKICIAHEVQFSVCDDLWVAKMAQVKNFHVDKGNYAYTELRTTLGEDAFLGKTISEVTNLTELLNEGWNYLAFQIRKEDDFEVVNTLLEQYNLLNASCPLFIFGELKNSQVASVIEKGAFGVGCSTRISGVDTPQEAVNQIRKAMETSLVLQ